MANPSRDTTTISASPSSTSSRASLSESRSPPQRNPSLRLSHMPSAAASHRQSFSDLQRHPPSPRANRQPSISQLAVQDLYDNPPHNSDSRFAGRDWRSIQVNELTSPDDLRFVEADTSVEDATNVGPFTLLYGRSLTSCVAPHRFRRSRSTYSRKHRVTLRAGHL